MKVGFLFEEKKGIFFPINFYEFLKIYEMKRIKERLNKVQFLFLLEW